MGNGVRRWIPPILIEYLKPLLRRGIYFSGCYDDFEAASRVSSGYDEEKILERVKAATLEVMAGRAAYERDSVLFREAQPPLPLVSGLLRACTEDKGRLSVLDFGGSLGSLYFQCRDFLSVVDSLHWNVVEQPHFVDCGRDSIESKALKFYYAIDEALQANRPNVILLASVLQYLPEPYATLNELVNSEAKYLIIDRTPFSDSEDDVITVQYVPPSIYEASYPCRVFSKQAMIRRLTEKYRVIADYNNHLGGARAGGNRFEYSGLILRRK